MISIIEECQLDRRVCEIKKKVEAAEVLTGEGEFTEEEVGPARDHVAENARDPKEVRKARGEEKGYRLKETSGECGRLPSAGRG